MSDSLLIRERRNMRLLSLFLFVLTTSTVFGQIEFTSWGDIRGIRIEDDFIEFNSSLGLRESGWDRDRVTHKEGQKIDFERKGEYKIFNYEMDSIFWKQSLSSNRNGEAIVHLELSTLKPTKLEKAFLRIELPIVYDSKTEFKFKDSLSVLDRGSTAKTKAVYDVLAKGLLVNFGSGQLSVDFEKETNVVIKKNERDLYELNFEIASGEIIPDKDFVNTFHIQAKKESKEDAVVRLKIFPSQQGKKFEGIGGNFRLQNPNADPQVIDYNLENLPVVWARVEMPWKDWHPKIKQNPVTEAKNGNLSPKVKAAMEMAQRLDQKGIPVILAVWFAPDWAIIKEPEDKEEQSELRGNRLNLKHKEEIYQSITSYIKYLEEAYGVKTVLFSFNEADLGIDVRQTEEEHDEMIKELGPYFEENGLETKFLLGDTADANGWDFTTLASTNPESRPYIGSVSFHAWRGLTDKILLKWYDISNRVGKPLIVGEGSIDAGAWRYPQIFQEPSYALEEIEAYIRIINITQPLSILQWQLTSDYSVLAGGGVFGNHEQKLHPTQRFFNLKQLGETSSGLFTIPTEIESNTITAAALGNNEENKYSIHLVNKGGTKEVKLSGLPKEINELSVYFTDKKNSNKLKGNISVKEGTAMFTLKGGGYTTLTNLNDLIDN